MRLKDTRRFPLVAPSCALLFLPFGLPVSFRCYGRVCLIPRLTLSSGKAVRSKLDCMHEPPVQSDRCALSGNYRLVFNLMDCFGDCAPPSQLPRFKRASTLANLRKSHLAGWFFRFQSKRLRRNGKDLKKIICDVRQIWGYAPWPIRL